MKCLTCGKEIDPFDEGFFKKMVNRGATEFTCIDCTADYFGITREKAEEMIEKFRRSGCTLFPPL